VPKPPLNVAFVWHMHQPFYKDLVTNEYILPWVRLHAIKDYYDMAAILDEFPKIKQTFNVVPSLLEQVEDYVSGNAVDKHLALTIKPPFELSLDEKVFILQNFFMANWDTMVNPFKRYHELLLKRGRFVSLEQIKEVAKRFTDQELLDLQVWFTLTWFGNIYRTRDAAIKGLLEKGRNFTSEDKAALLAKQKELISKVIPKYKELHDKGQIELSVTPYYHPILPLLVDTNSAKDALPQITLPQTRFRHPEDAKQQIDDAVKYFEKLFGMKPCGMWPSEGSVSEGIIPLVASAGIKWMATDEEILSMSFGRGTGGERKLASHELFKPYRLQRDGQTIYIIFRDHGLSDLVGFIYSKWNANDAANDLVNHLKNIRNSLPDDGKQYLVSIILDGENAWEYYSNNGWDFLSALYAKLSETPDIKTVRICDHLKENPSQDDLHHLFSGSWINHNFRVWIGHEEDNKAWDFVQKARLALESSGSSDPLAWKELYISEGSDWCWWYGDDHSSGNDDVFDSLFRKHLKNIYHLIGKQPPQYLDVPIKQVTAIKPTREPVDLLTPVLDGEVTNYYEWLPAGFYDIGKLKGAMHQAETVVNGIYYGFDMTSFHVRLDLNLDPKNSEAKELSFVVVVEHPKPYKIKATYNKDMNKYSIEIFKSVNEQWVSGKNTGSVGVGKIVEMSVSYEDVEVKPGDEIQMIVSVEKETQELERWPRGGSINFKAPDKDYLEKRWTI
jgi:alpha-amylase/alpha-mannosidase (GH57 family)